MGIVRSTTSLTLKNKKSDTHLIFSKPTFSNSDVDAKLVYQLVDDDNLILVWDFTLDMTTDPDYWTVRVNALNSKIINKQNFTVYCNHYDQAYNSTDRTPHIANDTHRCTDQHIRAP